jgi:hypothetical protein
MGFSHQLAITDKTNFSNFLDFFRTKSQDVKCSLYLLTSYQVATKRIFLGEWGSYSIREIDLLASFLASAVSLLRTPIASYFFTFIFCSRMTSKDLVGENSPNL